MLKTIDSLLNRITMYRLVLYELLVLLAAAMILGTFHVLPYSPLNILLTAAVLTAVSLVTNEAFAHVFKVHANVESVYITALILALIVRPITSLQDISYLEFLGWVALLSQASKYIVAVYKKHIFNPAAFAVALTAFTISYSAVWWIGTISMSPLVLLAGLLVLRKIRRFNLVISFFVAALITILAFSLAKGTGAIDALKKALLDAPLMFFAFVMLTEPLTTPPTRKLQIWYGALVGFLYAPGIHLASLYSTPELALLVGNIFSYAVSPKAKLLLTLKQKLQLTPDTYDFIFAADRRMSFQAGQYLEWTLGHDHTDSRGNRRYFTIASAPTEKDLHMGVKFYKQSSSFKQKLLHMRPGQTIVAGQLAGDFTLPRDMQKKLAFVAGGIGVTPFRSMAADLLNKNEQRDIVMLYSNKTAADIAYKKIFDETGPKVGLKIIYTLTEKPTPTNWHGNVGFIDEQMIVREIPDYKERIFYISGPQSMVTAFDEMLRKLGVKETQIVKDFFPGFA